MVSTLHLSTSQPSLLLLIAYNEERNDASDDDYNDHNNNYCGDNSWLDPGLLLGVFGLVLSCDQVEDIGDIHGCDSFEGGT